MSHGSSDYLAFVNGHAAARAGAGASRAAAAKSSVTARTATPWAGAARTAATRAAAVKDVGDEGGGSDGASGEGAGGESYGARAGAARAGAPKAAKLGSSSSSCRRCYFSVGAAAALVLRWQRLLLGRLRASPRSTRAGTRAASASYAKRGEREATEQA